jgi:hypothetical protein
VEPHTGILLTTPKPSVRATVYSGCAHMSLSGAADCIAIRQMDCSCVAACHDLAVKIMLRR